MPLQPCWEASIITISIFPRIKEDQCLKVCTLHVIPAFVIWMMDEEHLANTEMMCNATYPVSVLELQITVRFQSFFVIISNCVHVLWRVKWCIFIDHGATYIQASHVAIISLMCNVWPFAISLLYA